MGIGYSDGGGEGVVDCSAYGLCVVDSCRRTSVGICLLVCKVGVGDGNGEAVAGRGGDKKVPGSSMRVGIKKLLQPLGV